ncbi:hypothetical protein F4774DRAFT_212031 [Daldinia eschscholtzii]|nr:hypothetical protein F4774DRAFT_212031 [Daldinia eschscholtzii]
MAVWETEDELSSVAAASPPAPSDRPYRTSSRSSKKSRRSATPPGGSASPPPPLPQDKMEKKSKRSSKDVKTDENFGILDPRRFTPTLHANLVSEILSLRRDQEEKLKIIESLESTLHATQEEHETLQASLSNTSKESRSLKRQLSLLEGGSSSAIGELAKERDEAVDAITETRRRLEAAQKKVRTQEEDSQRVHDLWAKEKDAWDEERRRYERKLHVAETRLRVVLEEVANLQAAQMNGNHDKLESDAEKDNDGGSVRTMSMTNSVRYSVMSGPGFGKMNGYSLADELNFDDDDDYQTDPDGRQSVLSLARHHRNQSRDSIMSKSHRRNQSNDSLMRPGSIVRSRLFMNQTVLDRLEGGIREDDENSVVSQKVQYTDTGVQFSPPPSPKIIPAKPATPEPALKNEKLGQESPSRAEGEIEANQSRKRVYLNKQVPTELPKTKPMVSAASQTLEKAPLLAMSQPVIVEMEPAAATPSISIATQTEPAIPEQQPVSEPLSIPSISIVPPASRPASPREHRLPQYVKDFGCQVTILQSSPMRSASVQTDEIRIDKRLDKLPPHLHPSAITSRPSSPTTTPTTAAADESKNFTPVPGHVPPRNPRRLESSRRSFSAELPSSPPESPSVDDLETRDAYPGNNDDGPLSSARAPVRRPHRISSLFAGFDVQSSDEQDEFDGDQSDSEYRTALAPRPKTGPSKPNKRVAPSIVPTSPEQGKAIARQSTSVVSKIGSPDVYSSFRLADPPEGLSRKPSLRVSTGAAGRSLGYAMGSRASVMRKSAMIQSGIASHQGLSKSPDLLESRDPPFPIPTRASSRKPPFSASAPSDGQRSPTHNGEYWPRRGRKVGAYRTSSIRKARSAAALPQNQRSRRHASRSPPPPMSPSEEAPESPGLPPLPTNDITTPRRERGGSRYRTHRSQPSTNTANTENTNTGSVGSNQQSSSVVDAIAQTMVGEWMYKYVRRRKSFGVADGAGRGEENSNDRHKRWVWLAPYERAILWSSKQPANGNALMGKPGRKLTIQSVLDVKDDNPPPKGSTQIFNRSILILTPQRALKFTATTAERHYLWLTSLSFLAHSQQDVPEIIPTANSPNIGPAPDFEAPQTKAKRPGIRDSIRLTKGRNPALMARHDPVPTTNHLEEALSAQQESFPPIPTHQRELSREAAEPPFIPRFHERSHERVHERANQVVLHGRKRSNTGGHVPPPLSFRGFSGPASHSSSYHASTNSTAGNSVGTAGSSDIYQSQGSSNMTWGNSTAGSQRTSEASSRPPGNFFEAIGTVRMEAFISPLTFPRFDDHPDEQEEWRYRARRRSKEARRRRSRSRHRDSYASRGTRGTDSYYSGSRAGEEDYFRDDPFKGF